MAREETVGLVGSACDAVAGGRRWRGGSIGSGSGRQALTGCRVRRPGWWSACRRRWDRDGSVRVAACGQSLGMNCRNVACRLEEREEIAILRVQDCGVREIAWRLGRATSTISRELRRNAATRGGYWTTGPRPRSGMPTGGRRPKLARLAANGALRQYVQDRLAGCHHPQRAGGGRSRCPLDRAASRAPATPPVGQRLEPGADRPPPAGRFPR